MESFDTVRQELEAKRLQLESDLQSARGHVAEIEADLARVDEALGALTGQKKKSRSRSRSRKKPALTIDQLQQHIADVRHEKPFLGGDKLLEEVRSLVRESGASLAKFKGKFAEALAGSPGMSGSRSAPLGTSESHPQREDFGGSQESHGGGFSHGISFESEESSDPDESEHDPFA